MTRTELTSWQRKHIIKLRDYKEPTVLEEIKISELREVVEPWLTALFQSEHLSLFTGAGIPSAVHELATGETGAGMEKIEVSVYEDQIKQKSKETAKKSGRGEANVEDEIRTINELIKGLDILLANNNRQDLKDKLSTLKQELNNGITEFANNVLKAEKNIVTSTKDAPAEYLMNFLLSFASRIATRERLNLFTTNYDRIIEFGAELAGLHLL